MNSIVKFIDRVTLAETRGGKDLVLSISDARSLRDEIAKLLLNLHNSSNDREKSTTIEFVGEKW